MTEPFVPPDLDLRGFDYMPLKIVQLRGSDLATIATGDEFRAAVLLWCASWHEVPASSLPTDDRLLARAAGYGRDIKGWMAVKAVAMHGFELCSDERFYHPLIADLAIEAFKKRKQIGDKMRNVTSARLRKRGEQRDDERHEQRHEQHKSHETRNATSNGASHDTSSSRETPRELIGIEEELEGEGEGNKEGKKERKKEEKNYVFEGQVIRLLARDFKRWKAAYSAITDLRAELTKADDYFVTHPSSDGNWFHRTSSWLEKAHTAALKGSPQSYDPRNGAL